ncbi:MAG TPA: dienelactone hydrolase family protein [Verrucomicrobiae bacterium]|jgi:dienelactone hydrolase|nr:dienelactone hydrolase family protein [Verrucomicrobiae bacterium]
MNQKMTRVNRTLLGTVFFALLATSPRECSAQAQTLPGTQPLEMQGDIASNMVIGIDQFLSRKLDESAGQSAQYWHRNFSSAAAYQRSIGANRERLAHLLGVADQRVDKIEPELISTPTHPALIGRGQGYEIFVVRWPAFGDVTAEGLLLKPTHAAPVANVIAVPDVAQTPEQIAGLVAGVAPESQFARRLAESGCQVIIPTLISRRMDPRLKLSDREFIYRSAFEMGRHVVGYDIEKVLAAVDWMSAQSSDSNAKIGVIGWGEGGLVSFYAAALDTRISAACVSGYFNERSKVIWREPIDRNLFGLLGEFGDAEVAAMIAPNNLIIEAAKGPEVSMPGGGAYTPAQEGNGAPGILKSPALDDVKSEFARARALIGELRPAPRLDLITSGDAGQGPFGSQEALTAFLSALTSHGHLAGEGSAPEKLQPAPDAAAREARQVHELDLHNQRLLAVSQTTRQKFMKNLDTTSPEKFQQSAAVYRDIFYRHIIGKIDDPLLPPNPRSRVMYDEPKWTGYEVVMDVFPNVIARGILLVPKDLKPGERRPVVVCQHGLEGRSEDTIKGDSKYYHDFAARLCEMGFVTFAPQNPYIFEDTFRTLQRKANPLGKSLFSIIVPQHQQITDWLKTQPFVDPNRIAFYGLSYGGKSAVRLPALVTNYCLSICSGDFNDWIWKCATTDSSYSYVWSPEYEMYEFNMGNTFNYSDVTALIAPRPFMVERGHFDQVAPDDRVAYEFANVRFLYEARLGLHDQCTLEWFTGPHTIHGKGTFDFLREHLDWPATGTAR